MAELSLGDQVRNLLGQYCDLMDAGRWAGVGQLFEHGQLRSGEAVLATGTEEVTAFFERGTQLHPGPLPSPARGRMIVGGEHPGVPRTKHLVLNTVISVLAGGLVVEARSSYLVLQAIDETMPLQPIITGRYEDTFEMEPDGGLRWRQRAFTVDLVGDLSHHLTWSPPT